MAEAHTHPVSETAPRQLSPDEEQFVLSLKKCVEISKKSERDRISRAFAGKNHLDALITTLVDVHENCQHILAIGTERIVNIPEFLSVLILNSKLFVKYLKSKRVNLQDLLGLAVSLKWVLNGAIASMNLRFILRNSVRNTSTLTEYIERGEKIVKSGNYPSSNMKKVDEFIRNPDDFFEKNRFDLQLPSFNVSFNKTFVALAAPSLEGKTQTAFTLRNANPLYFPLNAASCGEGGLQEIYEPFIDHAVFLRGLAVKDLAAMQFKSTPEVLAPTAYELKTKYGARRFLVLGFFAEIMRQAVKERNRFSAIAADASNVGGQDSRQLPNWMHFYAIGLEPFDCPAMTIEEFVQFLQTIQEPFCLFLDEFLSRDWSVFIRNLARAVGFTCIVSNTNTNIANLVSRGAYTSREGQGADQDKEAWSLVFRRLDNVDRQVIKVDQVFRSVRQYSPFRVRRVPQLDHLFENLFTDWFYNCRPGIAVWILEALEELLQLLRSGNESFFAEQVKTGRFAEGNAFTPGSFLQFICSRVAARLMERKRRMVSRLNGQVAKLGILTDAAYWDYAPIKSAKSVPTVTASGTTAASAVAEVDSTDFEPFKFIQFLENHLYYLINPTGSKLDYFLTFRPEDANGDEEAYLRLAWQNPGHTNVDFVLWDLQMTTFRKDELFTIISCLFLNLNRSTNYVLHHANRRLMASNMRIADLTNLNAFKLSGNHLEVATAMACVEASHHTAGPDPCSSLHGQDGLTWLTNVISNCCLSLDFRDIELIVSDDWLKGRLESLHMPFLYGINNENVLFEQLSAVGESGIFARNYIRTKDSDSIDGRFEFIEYDVNEMAHYRECAVECKNYGDSLGASDFTRIFNKAMTGTLYRGREFADLFLIFTNDVKNPDEDSSLRTICESNEINLYRITKLQEPTRSAGSVGFAAVKFEVVPHHPEWSMFADPKSIGIIFEMDTII